MHGSILGGEQMYVYNSLTGTANWHRPVGYVNSLLAMWLVFNVLSWVRLWLSPHSGWTAGITSVIGQPPTTQKTHSTCLRFELIGMKPQASGLSPDNPVSLSLCTIRRQWILDGINLTMTWSLLSKFRKLYDTCTRSRSPIPRLTFILSADSLSNSGIEHIGSLRDLGATRERVPQIQVFSRHRSLPLYYSLPSLASSVLVLTLSYTGGERCYEQTYIPHTLFIFILGLLASGQANLDPSVKQVVNVI